jgi:hypothetical protein
MSDNVRIVKIPCIECGHVLKFRIENDIVVASDGPIAINIPCTVCKNCTGSLLDKVADPPGLICVKELSVVMAREIVRDFSFLLPTSYAIEFFASLFPDGRLKSFWQ